MAKGNMFQGMARGKVGDVVFSRANGEQISRVRNRHPYNPRSNAQLYQRAIMATIVQAYSAAKEIFDHSFEGLSVGAQNQREFIRQNAKMLRELVSADINTPLATANQKARVKAPKVTVPVPNPYIISKGSYQNYVFKDVSMGYQIVQPQENEKAGAYMNRIGLIAGDIYTFLVFLPKKTNAYVPSDNNDVLAAQRYCDFKFIRLIVKSDINADAVPATYGDLFTIEVGGEATGSIGDILTLELDTDIVIGTFFNAEEDDYTNSGAIGCIRSRRDQDLRSNSVMKVEYGRNNEEKFGIASTYLLDAWKSGTTSIGDSELILEGGDI